MVWQGGSSGRYASSGSGRNQFLEQHGFTRKWKHGGSGPSEAHTVLDSCCCSTGGRMLAIKAVTHLNKGDPRVKGVSNSEGIEGTTMRINPKAQRQF